MKENQVCPHDYRVSCNDCVLSKLCVPIALEADDIDLLDRIVQRGRPLQKGDHLYRQNDEFKSLYAVRSGCVKTFSVSSDGIEQVTGFYFPGEVLGMDGIGMNRHTSSAIALETVSICEFPFNKLGELSQQIPSLQKHCFQLMSQEIVNDQMLAALLSKGSAECRIASFLLSISARNERRRLSPVELRLPMSRSEMGNYLGLTVETVSRVFSKFQKTELLRVNNKSIRINDVVRLRALSIAS